MSYPILLVISLLSLVGAFFTFLYTASMIAQQNIKISQIEGHFQKVTRQGLELSRMLYEMHTGLEKRLSPYLDDDSTEARDDLSGPTGDSFGTLPSGDRDISGDGDTHLSSDDSSRDLLTIN